MSGALNRFQDLNLSERNPWAEAVLRSSRLFGPTAATLERAAEWELEEQLQALRERQQGFYEQIEERQISLAEAAQRLREEAFKRGIAQEDEEKANALAFLDKIRQLFEQYGAGTPGTPGTPEIPAINYPWNQPGFLTHVTPEDQAAARAAQGTLPQDQPAVPATPAIPGTPGNPVLSLFGQLMVPGVSSDIVSLGVKTLLGQLTQGGPVDYRGFLDLLNPRNPIRGIPWYAITEADIDNAIRWELGMKPADKSSAGGGGTEGGGSAAGGGTDWIKEIDDSYELFSKSNPQTVARTKYSNVGRAIGTEWVPNPRWMDKEKFIRTFYGDEAWARYAQAKNLFGDKYKGEVGFYILKNGGVGKALENDLKEMPLNVAKELIARYNKENHTNYDLGYWVGKWEKAHGVR